MMPSLFGLDNALYERYCDGIDRIQEAFRSDQKMASIIAHRLVAECERARHYHSTPAPPRPIWPGWDAAERRQDEQALASAGTAKEAAVTLADFLNKYPRQTLGILAASLHECGIALQGKDGSVRDQTAALAEVLKGFAWGIDEFGSDAMRHGRHRARIGPLVLDHPLDGAKISNTRSPATCLAAKLLCLFKGCVQAGDTVSGHMVQMPTGAVPRGYWPIIGDLVSAALDERRDDYRSLTESVRTLLRKNPNLTFIDY